MTNLQEAAESAVPVSRLHEHRSFGVADFEVPRGREEQWRFTPLRRLRGLHTDTALPPAKVAVECDLAPEVTAEDAVRTDPRVARNWVPADRVSARAFAAVSHATVLTVPRGVAASRPSTVSVRGDESAGAAFGHLVVEVGREASATVVLDYTGSATYADNVELIVGDGAQLTVVSVQDWAADTVHLSHHQAQVGRDARLVHTAVTLGGSVVRLAPSVSYAGPGGDAELRGLYFADTGQHLEHRLFVDHSERNCRSRVAYKGALQGDGAHAVWIGDVVIRAEATGTDTYEYNRNLVLSDGTRVDSVPNLEILTGEVAARATPAPAAGWRTSTCST